MKRKQLTAFRSALFDQNKTQRDLSRETGIHESLISLAVRGRYIFDRIQQAKIAMVLDKTESELFGNVNEMEG